MNNGAGLEKSIISYQNQKSSEFSELIVIDGLSKDNSIQVINKYKSVIDKVVVEKDSGIFDAMNKGVDHANGDYIYFLNSGDTFAAKDVLERVNKHVTNKKVNIFCGDVDILLNNKFYKKADVFPWLPHQGVFLSTNLMRDYKFDTNLKIFGDLDLWKRLKDDGNLNVEYLNFPIAQMEMDGMGNNPIYFKRRLRDKKIFNKKHNINSYILLFLYIDGFLSYAVYKILGMNVYWKNYIVLRMKIKRLISGN